MAKAKKARQKTMSTAQTVGQSKVWVNKVLYMVPDPVADELSRQSCENSVIQNARQSAVKQVDLLDNLVSQLYQIVGSLVSDLGVFDEPRVQSLLNELSEPKGRDLLPWSSFERVSEERATEMTPKEREIMHDALKASVKDVSEGQTPDTCPECHGTGKTVINKHIGVEDCPECGRDSEELPANVDK